MSGHMFVAGLDIVFGFQAKFCVKNLHTGDGVSFTKKNSSEMISFEAAARPSVDSQRERPT